VSDKIPGNPGSRSCRGVIEVYSLCACRPYAYALPRIFFANGFRKEFSRQFHFHSEIPSSTNSRHEMPQKKNATVLIAGVPSSQALPGFLLTAPSPVVVSAVLGALAVWIQNHMPSYTAPPCSPTRTYARLSEGDLGYTCCRTVSSVLEAW